MKSVNCTYLRNGEECTHPKVKQRSFGWGLTICEELVKRPTICALKERYDKPAPPPAPPKVGSNVKKVQIEVSGAIGTGRSAVAAIIMNALKDTIPNCRVSFIEDGHTRSPVEVKELRDKAASASPDAWFEYDVTLKTREILEM